MALLLGLLGIASMLLIANTIRLSLYARRREVEVMKLVGATDWFIRWPFVLEGVIVGALGGMLAILLLVVAKVAVVDPLAQDFALIAAPDTIDFRLLIGDPAGRRDRRLGAGLRPRPAQVPARLATSTATSSRRAPARAAAAIDARRDPRRVLARRRAQQVLQPARGRRRRRSCAPRCTPSVNSTSDSRALELEGDVEQLRVVDPAEHGARPTDVLDRARSRASTIGIGCPAQQIVARADAVELDAADRDRAVARRGLAALGEQRAVRRRRARGSGVAS